MNGIEMVLKNAGIDIKKITNDFELLKSGVITTLQSIEGRLKAIEERQENTLQSIKAIEERQENIWKALQGQQPSTPAQPHMLAQPPAAPQPGQNQPLMMQLVKP